MVKPWHRLRRAAVAALSLELSKARLEQPGLLKGIPAHGREWDEMSLKVPSNPNLFPSKSTFLPPRIQDLVYFLLLQSIREKN